MKMYLRNAPGLLSKAICQAVSAVQGNPSGKHKNLGVGMDTDALEASGEDVPEYIREAERKETVIRLLYIGHLDPGRNILFILETMKAIRDMGQDVILNW